MKNVIKLPEIIRDVVIITLLTLIAFSIAGCEDMMYKHICETCSGTGKCKECLGEGKQLIGNDVYTPYESDSGETYYLQVREEILVECTYCSGSGKCWTCKGRGKVAAGGDGKFHF